MKNAVSHFLRFLKSPVHQEVYSRPSATIFFSFLLFVLAIVVPFGLILDLAGVDQFTDGLEKLLRENKWVFAFAGIFVAPILEEPIFRLHLDMKKSSIWWSLGLSMLILGDLWYLGTAFMLYLIYLQIQVSHDNPPNLKFVFYTSAVFFALVHLGNYSNFIFAEHFYWIPFLVVIQFFAGLLLGYIRLNHGMKWAILFHGVYNAVLIIPAIYFYEGG